MASQSVSETLCIGDYVTLYCNATEGYVANWQTSESFSSIYIFTEQTKKNPEKVSNPHFVLQNRYKLNKKYRQMLAQSKGEQLDDTDVKTRQAEAKALAAAETDDNTDEQTRMRGKRVRYGDCVQLKHLFTGKFIHVDTKRASSRDKNNLMVYLDNTNGKQAQFKILPRFKVKAERDVVQYLDQIIFESVKSGGQYFHASSSFNINRRVRFESIHLMRQTSEFAAQSPTIADGNRLQQELFEKKHFRRAVSIETQSVSELNLGVDPTGFTICNYYRPTDEQETMIRSGSAIRLFHKVLEAYLVAEGIFDDEPTENVHLHVREVSAVRPRDLDPSTSGITYWQILDENSILHGSVLRWGEPIRLRHMTTGMYLLVSQDGRVSLFADGNDPLTVFRFHSISKDDTDEIKADSYARIEHVLTSCWLHADNDEVYERHQLAISDDSSSVKELTFGGGALKKILSSKEQVFSDAYTLQCVEHSAVDDFNYVAGHIPFLRNLIEMRQNKKSFSPKTAAMRLKLALEKSQTRLRENIDKIVETFREITRFMASYTGSTAKNRQKLLRNLQVVDLIVELLSIPAETAAEEKDLLQMYTASFDVLHSYLKGPSRRNKLYFLKYLDFFQNKFKAKESQGLKIAEMLVELIRGNRRILDRISHDQIEKFVGLLKTTKSACYLDLLSVLCVCNGVAIPDNQTFITDRLLRAEQPNGLFLTDIGENINCAPGTIFISVDAGRMWIGLQEFVSAGKFGDSSNLENVNFLQRQFDLFKALTYGGNEHAIEVITQEKKYMTWKEAYLGVSSKALVDGLRAKYCDLLIVLFVDVSMSGLSSVHDLGNTCFVYEYLPHDDAAVANYDDVIVVRRQTSNVISSDIPLKILGENNEQNEIVKELLIWILDFIKRNTTLIASNIAHNMLIEQILRLLCHLIKHGFCAKDELCTNIRTFHAPLLMLLDGRNDEPYQQSVTTNQKEAAKILRNYRKKTRFEVSKETTAIVNAKYQALEILDVILSNYLKQQLNRFVELFNEVFTSKRRHETLHDVRKRSDQPLVALLSETFEHLNTSKKSLKIKTILNTELEPKNLLEANLLVPVLLDLTMYKYDKMMTKPLDFLNKYYSAKMDMFKMASQAQIITTPQSRDIHEEVAGCVSLLWRIGKSRLSDEQTAMLTQAFDKLTNYCMFNGDPNAPAHHINQGILINHNLLSILFDNISSEIDYSSRDEFTMELRPITIRCVHLLKAIAKDNDLVQRRIYDRMDVLLRVKGIESDMALLLKQAFVGNGFLCLKVSLRQLERIVNLISEHRENVPELLHLLSSMVKVIGPGTIVRRNQIYVMKYVMRAFNKIAAIFDESREMKDFRMSCLLGEKGEKCRDYLLQLISLLSICAEGENHLIDTLCKTILKVDEILDIINHPNIGNHIKCPFVIYLHTVYLEEGSEIGTADITHNRKLWSFLENIRVQIVKVYKFMTTSGRNLVDMLKTPLTTGIVIEANDEAANIHATVHYLFDAVFPFLNTFLSLYYVPADVDEYPDELQIIKRLTNVLMHYCQGVMPMVTSHAHVKIILTTMVIHLSIASTRTTAEGYLLELKRIASLKQYHDGVVFKDFSDIYTSEILINDNFQCFVRNCSLLYGGRNTVSRQLNISKSWAEKREYTKIGSDESLPLGEEFQQHVQCFLKTQKKEISEQYSDVERILGQLGVSSKQGKQNEALSLRQDALNIKSLQLLRAMIHNEVVQLPTDWESNRKRCPQLKRISAIQNVMIDKKVFPMTMSLMDSANDEIVKEMLAFMLALLFNANTKVQSSMESYFESTRKESFFFAIQSRIQLSVGALKEKRALDSGSRSTAINDLERILKQKRFRLLLSHVDSLLLDPQRDTAVKKRKTGFLRSLAATGHTVVRHLPSSKSLSLSNVKQRMTNSRKTGKSSNKTKNGRKNGGVKPATAAGECTDGAQDPFTNIETVFMVNDDGNDVNRNDNHWMDDELTEDVADTGDIQSVDNETDQSQVIADDDRSSDVAQHEELAYFPEIISERLIELKDEGSIELILEVLAHMCDGQHNGLQNYIRDQPDNIRSVNTIQEIITFLSSIYANIKEENIELVIQIFNTLNEFTCGNQQTRLEIVSCKVIDMINVILREGDYSHCPEDKVFELKQMMGNLVISIIEENGEHGVDVAKDVKDTIDLDAVCKLITSSYERHTVHPPRFEDLRFTWTALSTFVKQTKDYLVDIFNYIRDQPDNIRSVNTIQEIITFLSSIYANIKEENIELVIQIFNTLNEFTCGNQQTRLEIVSCKVIDMINVILREGDYSHCPEDKVFELKQMMGNLVISIIEENGEHGVDVAKDVKDTIDLDAVCKLITSSYERHTVHPPRFEDLRFTWTALSTFVKQTKDYLVDIFYERNQPGIKWAAKDLGFTYYLIMQRFFDIDPTLRLKYVKQDDQDINPTDEVLIHINQAFSYYGKNVVSIELIKDNCIQKVNFRIANKSVLREEVKEKLKWTIDRSSPTMKLRDFVAWYEDIREDIKHQKLVLSNFVTAFIARQWSWWNSMVMFLSIAINVYMLIVWQAALSMSDLENLPADASLPSALFNSNPRVDDPVVYGQFVDIAGAIHNFFSFLVLVGYFLSNHSKFPKIVVLFYYLLTNHRRRPRVKELFNYIAVLIGLRDENLNQIDKESEKQFNSDLAVHLFSFKTLYYMAFFSFSILGTTYSVYFFSFHLLNIIITNQLLGGVIKAVTKNGRSLIWVAVLGVVILYLYSLVAFAFFRDMFQPTQTGMPGFCSTLFQCFISFVRYGLIGDYNQALVRDARVLSFTTFSYLIIFEVSFFIVITTIGLNIIFGIIVDTFQELRDDKWKAESDMRSVCFICNIDSFEFEHRAKGFVNHVTNEHSMWSYMYYLIYLHDTNYNDYTALDMCVYKQLQKQDLDFFPINRAISLVDNAKSTTDTKIDEVVTGIRALLDKQKQEESVRRRLEERHRQQQWTKAYIRFMHATPSTSLNVASSTDRTSADDVDHPVPVPGRIMRRRISSLNDLQTPRTN